MSNIKTIVCCDDQYKNNYMLCIMSNTQLTTWCAAVVPRNNVVADALCQDLQNSAQKRRIAHLRSETGVELFTFVTKEGIRNLLEKSKQNGRNSFGDNRRESITNTKDEAIEIDW